MGGLKVSKFFVCVVGVVLIIEGLPYFAFPRQLKGFLLKISEVSEEHLRVMGFVAMAAGLFLVYLAQRTGLFH